MNCKEKRDNKLSVEKIHLQIVYVIVYYDKKDFN